MFCRNCGKPVDERAAVCVACGFAPGTGSRFCKNCGTEAQHGAAVCLKCGVSLTGGAPLLDQKPGMLTAVAVITLVSGIVNILSLIPWLLICLSSLGVACLCLPVYAYLLVVGILELLYAVQLLAVPIKTNRPNKAIAVMEIVCIIGLNPIAVAAGILALVFYNDKNVTDYFNSRGLSA